MYVSLHFPFAPQTWFFQRFRKQDIVFPDFWQKDAGSLSQQKAGRGNQAWDPCFATPAPRKTTFSGTSSNCRAVRGGPPPETPTYLTSGRGGSVRVSDTPNNVGGFCDRLF